jgi:pSer/pThr/pTyr-binding forkhead associated (FHA) protein
MAKSNPATTVREELVLSFEGFDLRRIPVDARTITIGRLATNDVSLDDRSVSSRHAVVRGENGRRRVDDLGSQNGTIVNGVPVQSKILDHGDLIEVGIYRLRYLLHRPAERASAEAGATIRAALRFVSGSGAGTEQVLARSIHAVRGAGNQIAILSRRKEGWVITHLEGSAVPLVNGNPIGIGAQALQDGDLIELEGKVAEFRAGACRR